MTFDDPLIIFKFGWASFNVGRKAVAVGISFIAAEVSSTYLLKEEGTLFWLSSFSSIKHINVFAMSGPRGDPIATSSICSGGLPLLGIGSMRHITLTSPKMILLSF